MRDRTAKDFVDDMLSRDVNWMGILSVARQARKGIWREEAKALLQQRGLMPTDPKEINRLRDEQRKKDLSLERRRKARQKARRKARAPVCTDAGTPRRNSPKSSSSVS